MPAETACTQLAQREREKESKCFACQSRAVQLFWHQLASVAMFRVYKLVRSCVLAHKLSSSVSICFHRYGSLIDQLWHLS